MKCSTSKNMHFIISLIPQIHTFLQWQVTFNVSLPNAILKINLLHTTNFKKKSNIIFSPCGSWVSLFSEVLKFQNDVPPLMPIYFDHAYRAAVSLAKLLPGIFAYYGSSGVGGTPIHPCGGLLILELLNWASWNTRPRALRPVVWGCETLLPCCSFSSEVSTIHLPIQLSEISIGCVPPCFQDLEFHLAEKSLCHIVQTACLLSILNT